MSFGLTQKTISQLNSIFQKYPEIHQVKIYGSRARGDHRKGSDIDLAFFSESEEDLSSRLSWELDDLPTPYLFDVVNYDKLKNNPLKKEIDHHGKIFYIRKPQNDEIEKNKIHLEDRHRIMLENLFCKYLPNVEVWAYGSRVNGQSHEGSDLNLVLRGPNLEKVSASQFTDMREALTESNIPFLVAIKDWAVIPKSFHEEIKKNYYSLIKPKNLVKLQDKYVSKNWLNTNFGSICSLEYGKPLKKEDRKYGSYPVLGSNGVVGYHSEYIVKGPCIIVGRKGSAGGSYLFKS